METIEFALSHGTLHDPYQINKKACLLAMYDTISKWSHPYSPYSTFSAPQDVIMVSPMRGAGAARLTFGQCEHQFEWTGWNICDEDGPNIEIESSIAIGNILWTRYVGGTIIEHIFNYLKIYYTPSRFFSTPAASTMSCRQVSFILRCTFVVFQDVVSSSRTNQASDKIVMR